MITPSLKVNMAKYLVASSDNPNKFVWKQRILIINYTYMYWLSTLCMCLCLCCSWEAVASWLSCVTSYTLVKMPSSVSPKFWSVLSLAPAVLNDLLGLSANRELWKWFWLESQFQLKKLNNLVIPNGASIEVITHYLLQGSSAKYFPQNKWWTKRSN